VARGTQHRKRRPAANASVAARTAPTTRRPKRPAYEEQLFFGRLRTHAKILFVLMAAVFMLTFVFLGVGSGSTGIGQMLQNFFSGSSATGASLASLQQATIQHPKDAAAWLAYANKLQAAGQLDQAAAALTSYTALRPRDANQLRVLASIYYRRAVDWNTVYGDQQSYSQALTPSLLLTPASSSKLGQSLSSLSNPLTSAVTSQTSTATSSAYQQLLSDLNQRLQVYKKLAKLLPNDASTQLELAQAANLAGDTATEIAGYKAFLRLAPTDSQAPAARQALKKLEAQSTTKP
jgi:regulator of sirC expression with transglutaminase-like and TPR domain